MFFFPSTINFVFTTPFFRHFEIYHSRKPLFPYLFAPLIRHRLTPKLIAGNTRKDPSSFTGNIVYKWSISTNANVPLQIIKRSFWRNLTFIRIYIRQAGNRIKNIYLLLSPPLPPVYSSRILKSHRSTYMETRKIVLHTSHKDQS